MKNLMLTLIASLVFIFNADAQQYSRLIKNANQFSVRIILKNSNIKILGSDDNTFKIDVVNDKFISVSKSKIADSTGMGLNIRLEGQAMFIEKVSADAQSYLVSVPKDASVYNEEKMSEPRHLEIDSMAGKVEVKSWVSKIILNNNTGPVKALSEASDIFIKYSGLNQIKPSAIVSSGRLVDITPPVDIKANIDAEVQPGRFSSNFVKRESYKVTEHSADFIQYINIRLNGGGEKLYIKANTINLHRGK
jgi:hypothetical protein